MMPDDYAVKASNQFRAKMRFCALGRRVETPEDIGVLELPVPPETVRALYFNEPESPKDLLVFALSGIWWLGETQVVHVPYHHIIHVGTPDSKQACDTQEIEFSLTGGRKQRLPVRGGSGKYRDFFQVMTAALNVISLNSRHKPMGLVSGG